MLVSVKEGKSWGLFTRSDKRNTNDQALDTNDQALDVTLAISVPMTARGMRTEELQACF
jgi:hypothetical protein